LWWAEKVRPGDVVAIVGASFSGLMLKMGAALFQDDPIYRDPQEWLANALRTGLRPTYESDAWLDRNFFRR
jgi:hypothetical protein